MFTLFSAENVLISNKSSNFAFKKFLILIFFKYDLIFYQI